MVDVIAARRAVSIVRSKLSHTKRTRQQAALVMLSAAASVALANQSLAATFTYTPNNGSTDLWSTGTDWSATPISAATTELTFVGTNGTVLPDGLTNINTDNISGAFQLNIMDLQGTGPNTGAGSITIANASPATGLNFAINGTTLPIINLNALAGTGGLTYNVTAPVASNAAQLIFQGLGTANFNFSGGLTTTGMLYKFGGGTVVGSSNVTVGGTVNLAGGLTLGKNVGGTATVSANGNAGTIFAGTGSNVTIGNGSTAGLIIAANETSQSTISSVATLDLSNATTVNINVGNLDISHQSNGSSAALISGKLILGGGAGSTTNVTASSIIDIGNIVSTQQIGQASIFQVNPNSTVNVFTPRIGTAYSKANGSIIVGANSTLNLAGTTAAPRAEMDIATSTSTQNTSSSMIGSFDASATGAVVNLVSSFGIIGSANNTNTTAGAANTTGYMVLSSSNSNHIDMSNSSSVALGLGTMTVGRNLSTGTGTGAGSLTINGLDNTSSIVSTDTGPAVLVGYAKSTGKAVGTLNLNGTGTLTLTSAGGSGIAGSTAFASGTTNGNSTVNFNGLSLKAGSDSTQFINAITNTNVRNNGVTFDTGAHNITIPVALTHSVIGTVGAVSITNGGTGYTTAPPVTISNKNTNSSGVATATVSGGAVTGIVLTDPENFTSAPTFTIGGVGTGATATTAFTPDNATDGGLTKIGNGTLTLSNANTYNGPTNINAGTLNLTGSLTSPVNVNPTATLAGEGSTNNALTFNGNSALNYDPSTVGSLTAGSINASAGSVFITPTSAVVGTGQVVLSAAGGITGAIGTNFINTARGVLSFDNSAAPTQLLFNSTAAASLKWRGIDATHPTFWDLNTTVNWDNAGSPDVFFFQDSVTFDDSASSFAVAPQGTMLPASVTFGNSSLHTYTVQGSGAIGGSTPVTMNGTGTVIFTNTNSYTGGTTIFSGTIQLGDGTGLSGSLGSGAIIDNGALVTNFGTGTVALPNVISGNGTFTKSGLATLQITGNNSAFTGSTTISNGTLELDGAGNLGTGSIVDNSALVGNTNVTLPNNISGTGTLSITGANTVILTGTNNYNGNTTVNTGSTLALGAGGITGSINAGNILNSGTVSLNRSDVQTLGATINGTGAISMPGAGTTSLTGSNSAGNVDIGTASLAGTLVVPAGASLTIGTASTAGTLSVVNTVATTNNTATGTLDASTASSFTVNAASVIVGNTAGASGTGVANGTLKLPATSSITAGTIFDVGNSGGAFGGVGMVTTATGPGTVAIQTPVVQVGLQKSHGFFTVGTGDTVSIAGIAGARSSMFVGNYTVNSGSGNWHGLFDGSAGNVSLTLSGLAIGNHWSGTAVNGSEDGHLILGTGTNHLDISGPAANAAGYGGLVTIGTVGFNDTVASPSTGSLTIGNLDSTSAITTTDGGPAILMGAKSSNGAAIGTGTMNVNGGSLTISSTGNGITGGGGFSTLNLNGGTLAAGSSNANYITGLTAVNVRNGGITFDTGVNSVGIPQNLSHSTIGTVGPLVLTNGGTGYATNTTSITMTGGATGSVASATAIVNGGGTITNLIANDIQNYTSAPTVTVVSTLGTGATATVSFTPDNAIDGGLNKVGIGTLTLSGANTYTGNTNVNAGTLKVMNNAALGTGSVNLANTTKLAMGLVPGSPTVSGLSGFTSINSSGGYTPPTGSTLALTTAAAQEAVTAFNPTPVTVNDANGFTASFTYTHNTGSVADGITFMIQNQGLTALGGSGAAKGYALGVTPSTPNAAITNSGAFAIDIFNNASYLGTNGVLSAFTSGSIPFLSASGTINVSLSYDGINKVLTETLTNGARSYTTSASIDFAQVLGGTAGGSGTGYLGFSGATGGTTSVQSVSNFVFNDNTTGATAAAITNPVNVAASGSAIVQLAPTPGYTKGSVGAINVGAAGTLSIASPVLTGVSHGMLIAPSIMTAASAVDITNNDLDLTGQSVADVTTLVKSGFNNGTWTGTGIASSTAAGDASHLSAIGIASGFTSFDGSTVSIGDTIVKYTYYGDADLNGLVNGNDYSLIDFAFTHPNTLSGWSNGDFNYDGKIDGSDYSLIDNTFNRQGASLAASSASMVATNTSEVAGTSAVPEPTMVGVLGLVTMGALSRRRKAKRCV